MQERQRLRQEKSDKLTRAMLEVIYRTESGITPAADIVNKAILNFAIFASQFGQLSEAQPSLARYAEKCMKNHYDHFTKRAMMGYDDHQDLVDAVGLAHDIMPALLPAAYAACIEQEEREVLAQSIEMEIQRVNREKKREEAERLEAQQREAERLEAERREAEQRQANQPPQCNATDVSRLIVDRMSELANAPHLDDELTDSLKKSVQFFFNDTTGIDSEHLTSSATDFVDRMRDIEAQRTQRIEPNKRAAMSLVRQVGKIMSSLPDAVKQTLQVVTFNPEAPSMRVLPEDEAEFEEDDEQDEAEQSQGLPASGTPPGTPPPWNPRESPST